jgi:tetratricopeptide (TPR) repeat protein
LDALFLLGAAVAETPGMSRENMQKGLSAWETYLKLSPESPQKAQVDKGMEDIKAGLRGEGRLAQPLVPVSNGDSDASAPKNVMGGASSQQPAPMGPGSDSGAPKESRAEHLAADATPVDRAIAEGLDALDAQDFSGAAAKLEGPAKSATGRSQSEARVGLGRAYFRMGRQDDAMRLYGEVLKVDPDYSPAWHYLGMAHMMSGDPAQAAKDWQKIVDKDPAYAQQFHLDQRIEVAKRMGGH